MAMGRGVRVFHTPPHGQGAPVSPYSVLLEQKGGQHLLLESQAIISLSSSEAEPLKRSYIKLCDAFGVLGNLRLNCGDSGVLHYLCLVTGCVSVGKLGHSEVYKITDVKMFSLRGYNPDEEKVSEVRKLFTSGSAYFSWSSQGQPVDLTMSLQKANKHGDKVSDHRFFWNRMLHLPYIRAGIDSSNWLLKVMVGSAEIRTVYVGAKQAKAAIISRLSNERAGTRFMIRGVNDDGHVANFVETEQLVSLDNFHSSFVQIRGSVPLFWEQPGINVGSHKIRMSRGPELSQPSFDSHFQQLKERYGTQIIVNLLGSNLVGSKEGEATLSTAFQTHQSSSDKHTDIPHILWDFHNEGGAKKIDKLDFKVSKYVDKLDYFHSNGNRVISTQTGVVRTNCTDCLDRTNAVQLYLGLKILGNQLKALELTGKDNIVLRFEESFKQMWVNNGNSLSKIYAGTGALSTGGSKLLDGARSAARTIQNNLLDKDKQEAFDLLIHGTGRNTDFVDRARLLLPPEYIHAPVPLMQSVVKKWTDYTYSEPLRVAIGTYNINGGKHFRSVVYKNVSLDDWLLDAHTGKKDELISIADTKEEKVVDFYAIGFEEMVDLDAKNIVNASKENGKEWALELAKTLNRDRKYCLVTFHQLVGVCLYVFVRPELAPHVRDVMVDDVKTGMGGATGNKGAVAISLTYKANSICFLCSHFAAGQSQVSERNNDYSEAVKKVSFSNGRSVLSHDYVFWCGDFNYRINLPRDEVKDLVAKGNLTELVASDQLKIEHNSGNVFQSFQEGDVTFPPTYKYDLFSDDFDTSEKARSPAWTDRVLWRRRKPQGPLPGDWSVGNVAYYGRAELKQSDHRPVLAVLDVQARVVDLEKRKQTMLDVLSNMGPSDGTIVSTPCAGAGTIGLSEDVIAGITSAMSQFGDVRYSRAVRGSVWTQFREGGAAMMSLEAGQVSSGGVEWLVTPPCTNWNENLKEELSLVTNPVIPLTSQTKGEFSKDSAKLLSQISQLSFEELESITLARNVAPPKPPPPRPAVPPGRPKAPPSRPSNSPAAPTRPDPPVSRPAPPPPSTTTEEPRKQSAGFSDLFCAPPDPDLDMDIPISLSSGSLVSLTATSGEATPAPTKPPLPSSASLEYPDNYDPLLESGKCWDSGQDQTIPTSPEEESDSGQSTPNYSTKPPPTVPSRQPASPPQGPAPGPPQGPPPGPPPGLPPSLPPPGPPPKVPSRPSRGPPPPVPKR